MVKKTFRSNCPINSALELIGDKWSLLILRDMLLANKRTFKEFSNSQEGISTNILTDRLVMLEEVGILTKTKLPSNKKMNLYQPTELGLALLPVIMELIVWGSQQKDKINPEVDRDRITLANAYQENPHQVLKDFRSQFQNQ